jgi:glucose/arabinose dehydrogenase
MRLGLAVCLCACGDNKPLEPFVNCDVPTPGTTVEMRLVAQVPNPAMLVTSPPRDRRLFVVEQTGSIRIIENGVVLAEPFLDLSEDVGGPVISGGENGLLGLAFHPNYEINRTFFISYTARLLEPNSDYRHRLVLARCTVGRDPDKADSSCVDVHSILHTATNHNGGMIEFGADGYLYWGTGDGGGTDRGQNAQSLDDGFPLPTSQALLGKILRLDVDHRSIREYGIPPDNPYAHGGGRPEIFIVGLRNPWRWSFDRHTNDMWIADVGQSRVEELTVLRPSQQNGANLGWSIWEGTECFTPDCTLPHILPQHTRLHSDGWTSITGGQVYRGSCFPDLQGTYFFTDYDDVGRLSTATLHEDGSLTITDLPGTFPPLGASIHADAGGELYETDTSGNVFQLVVTGP